jgi:hypothetical protein
MPDFPTLSSGRVALYPLVKSKRFRTRVLKFVNQTEKRWASGPATNEFVLSFTGINGYDLSLVRAFWISMKGGFTEFTFTLEATAYQYLVFEDDEFPVANPNGNRYTFNLKLMQTRS